MAALIVMMWVIYSGMKKFLSDNIEEALIVAGDSIGDRIKSLNSEMTGKMNALHNENMTLRSEITGRLDALSKVISDSNSKSELGVNSIVKELNYIIPTLRDEMKKLLYSLSENAETFQRDTIKNLDAEIEKFIHAVNSSCKSIRKSAEDQSILLANMAGTVQSVMEQGTRNLQSEFSRTHSELRQTITDSLRQIDADYQDNMKKMFAAMANNLAAITQQLREANAESPANLEEFWTVLQSITTRLDRMIVYLKQMTPEANMKEFQTALQPIIEKLDKMIESLTPITPDKPEKPKSEKKPRGTRNSGKNQDSKTPAESTEKNEAEKNVA